MSEPEIEMRSEDAMFWMHRETIGMCVREFSAKAVKHLIINFKVTLTIFRNRQEALLMSIERNTNIMPKVLQSLRDLEMRLGEVHPDFWLDVAPAQQQGGDDFMDRDVLRPTPKYRSSSFSSKEPNNKDRREFFRTGLGIPTDHTSSVSKTFLWQSCRNFLGNIDPNYPTKAEGKRDVLRPYSNSQVSPPSYHQGMNGALKLGLNSNAVNRLLNIYKRHINDNYPIFSNYELNSLVKGFLKSIDAISPTSEDEIGSRKRRRFEGRVEMSVNTFICYKVPQGSVEYAIVLVTLALGEVCGQSEIVHQKGSSNSPADFHNGYPSPSDICQPKASIHNPVNENAPQTTSSVAVTPGLAYFTAAIDIMKNHFGTNTLGYVRLQILASLYLGQLTRVSECHAYLHEAIRVLQVISRR